MKNNLGVYILSGLIVSTCIAWGVWGAEDAESWGNFYINTTLTCFAIEALIANNFKNFALFVLAQSAWEISIYLAVHPEFNIIN